MSLPVVDPVLALLTRDVPRGPEWTYEPKLDGFRGMLYVDNGRGAFRSKTKRPMPRFAGLAEALARRLGVREAILDGELIVLGRSSRPDFAALMYHRGVVQYAAFDLVWLNGNDLRELPLRRRRRVLQKLVTGTPVGLVESSHDPALLEAVTRLDLEGIVAKRTDDPYSAAARWAKVKNAGYSQRVGRWEMFDRRR